MEEKDKVKGVAGRTSRKSSVAISEKTVVGGSEEEEVEEKTELGKVDEVEDEEGTVLQTVEGAGRDSLVESLLSDDVEMDGM